MTQSSFYFIMYEFCNFSISQKAAKTAVSWGDQLEPDHNSSHYLHVSELLGTVSMIEWVG